MAQVARPVCSLVCVGRKDADIVALRSCRPGRTGCSNNYLQSLIFLLSHNRRTDEGRCPFGLAAPVSKEVRGHVDALDVAGPSFCFGSAAACEQVCFDLVEVRSCPGSTCMTGAAEANMSC